MIEMKLNSNYICREICGEVLLIPVGEEVKRHKGIFSFSDTGAFLIKAFVNGADIPSAASALTEAYDVDADTALQDTSEFADELIRNGIFLE